MEGTYPVIVDGELVGKLTVCACGAQTSFDVECRMLPGIVRLSVYGADKEGYLGVLSPEGEGLSLHKKLSRSAMRDFPARIDAVEPSGLQRTAAVQTDAAEAPPDPEPAPDPEPERCWYAATDGALVCFDGARNLVALPPEDGRIPADAAGERCTVEGREYRVFPTENGRICF